MRRKEIFRFVAFLALALALLAASEIATVLYGR